MRNNHRTVAASLLAVFTVVVDNTKVNVALPSLARALAVDETTLQWIVESYVLAFAAPLLLGGAIADRYGPGVTMRVGLLGFAAGSVVAALAPSAGVLVAARVLTGLAAALVMPATMAAVVAAPGDRSRAVAGWTGVVALGVAVGPVVGGALLVVAAWPSLFWLNVPLALGSAAALPGPAAAGSGRAGSAVARLDVRGSVLLAGVLLGVVAAVTEAPRHPWLAVPAGLLALSCGAGYARHQRHGDPVLPLRLLRTARLRESVGALSAMFGAIFGVAFLLPQYLQSVRGVGPLGTGLYILAYAFALVVASVVAVLGAVAVAVTGPAATGSALLEGVRVAAAVAAALLAVAAAVTARSSVLASDAPTTATGAVSPVPQ